MIAPFDAAVPACMSRSGLFDFDQNWCRLPPPQIAIPVWRTSVSVPWPDELQEITAGGSQIFGLAGAGITPKNWGSKQPLTFRQGLFASADISARLLLAGLVWACMQTKFSRSMNAQRRNPTQIAKMVELQCARVDQWATGQLTLYATVR